MKGDMTREKGLKRSTNPFEADASLKRNPTPSALCMPGGGRKTNGEAGPERLRCWHTYFGVGTLTLKRKTPQAEEQELNPFLNLRTFQRFFFLLFSQLQPLLLINFFRCVFTLNFKVTPPCLYAGKFSQWDLAWSFRESQLAL